MQRHWYQVHFTVMCVDVAENCDIDSFAVFYAEAMRF